MSGTLTRILIGLGIAVFFFSSLLIADAIKGPTPTQVQRTALQVKEEAAQHEAELRDVLQWGCEYTGNPLRRVIQALIREDIKGSSRVKASYFPNIPKKVLHHLIRVQIAAKRRQLKRAAPVNCQALYHSPIN